MDQESPRIFTSFFAVSALALMLFAGCAQQKVITMAWLPNNSGDNEKAMRAEFGKIIEEATGYKVKNKLATDFNIAIAAFDAGDAQAWLLRPSTLTPVARSPARSRQLAVGVSSMKCMGDDAAISVTPRTFNISCPVSCTMRSRANRSGLSTMIVFAPLANKRSSISAKPGHAPTGSLDQLPSTSPPQNPLAVR